MASLYSRTRTRWWRKSASRRCCWKFKRISGLPIQCVMAVPAAQYTTAIHTIEPGTWTPKNVASPDRPHRMPMKLISVTTAFNSPMDSVMV